MSVNAAWNIVNFRAGLVRALVADGHEVIAAVMDDGSMEGIRTLGARAIAMPMSSRGVSVLSDLGLLVRYVLLFRRERPDVYLGWTIKPNVYGSMAAALSGVRSINNVSGLGTAFIRTNWLTVVARILYRVGLMRSSTVFFQNGDDRDLFVGRGMVEERRTALLPGSGIDCDAFDPAAHPVVPDGMFRFLLVARLIADKGVHEYVAAARMLRDEGLPVRFQILGFLDVQNRTAISREAMDGWIADGLVDYLGAATDVRPVIARADCVVLPSYREGTSRVLLEAAAMATPAITTDVPGCRDVVRDGVTGLLCRARDAADLADAMRRMVHLDEADRSSMGRAARRDVMERFSEAAVIARYREAIASALKIEGVGKERVKSKASKGGIGDQFPSAASSSTREPLEMDSSVR